VCISLLLPMMASVGQTSMHSVQPMHQFLVIKRQFGYLKVRYRGLKKNPAQLITLFALSNL
jgi:IS5 family transposase